MLNWWVTGKKRVASVFWVTEERERTILNANNKMQLKQNQLRPTAVIYPKWNTISQMSLPQSTWERHTLLIFQCRESPNVTDIKSMHFTGDLEPWPTFLFHLFNLHCYIFIHVNVTDVITSNSSMGVTQEWAQPGIWT